MKKQWSMVGAIVLFLGISILSVLNVDPVPVNFGFAVVEWPLIVIIFVSVLLGALIATLLSTYKMFIDQRKHKHQESDISSSTSETPSKRRTRSGKKKADSDQNDKSDTESGSEKKDIL
jgi:putative membrane protein